MGTGGRLDGDLGRRVLIVDVAGPDVVPAAFERDGDVADVEVVTTSLMLW